MGDDVDDLRQQHTPEAVGQRLERGPRPHYVQAFVLGAIDGAVTTFAVAAGAIGASLAAEVVVILGAANLFADGFSMAAGNFLGARAEAQRRARVRRDEELHIDSVPAGEREEIRQIFARKGFSGTDLDRAVQVVSANRDIWIDTMLREEHGLPQRDAAPIRTGAATFASFVVVGVIPLLPFLASVVAGLDVTSPFTWSCVLTGITFVAVGAAKGRLVRMTWWRSALETLAIGGGAALVAYEAGALVAGIV